MTPLIQGVLNGYLQAARSMMPVAERSYRQVELMHFIQQVESDVDYQTMLGEVAANLSKQHVNGLNQVSFLWAGGI
ncbi:hypothetical protein [uncultured Shewanella sp.]|uniref:hypothetical protein n=1 Tax=uncultured Shewanella sp. TaxID=173975 RepID=UPI00260A7429|nr:hypothetical protein [uncultured Shewanella sp.]